MKLKIAKAILGLTLLSFIGFIGLMTWYDWKIVAILLGGTMFTWTIMWAAWTVGYHSGYKN